MRLPAGVFRFALVEPVTSVGRPAPFVEIGRHAALVQVVFALEGRREENMGGAGWGPVAVVLYGPWLIVLAAGVCYLLLFSASLKAQCRPAPRRGATVSPGDMALTEIGIPWRKPVFRL